MFGYTTNETPELMPMAVRTAHRLTERLTSVRKSGQLPFLRPDGKAQVTLGYEGAVPCTVDTVVVSTQHQPDVTQDQVRDGLNEVVIGPVVEESGLDLSDIKVHVNPSGSFVMGGPKADAGLTGQKIITSDGTPPQGSRTSPGELSHPLPTGRSAGTVGRRGPPTGCPHSRRVL